jgi:hypothetical protein
MSVRAKFRVSAIKTKQWSKGAPSQTTVELDAVWADGIEENKRYAKYTPSGKIELTIDNPPALEFFEIGKYVYVDFTEAPQ